MPEIDSRPLIFVFNGDADGIVSQHILKLHEGRPERRVTGYKRDIRLLRHLEPPESARIHVFDVSLKSNLDRLPLFLAKEDVTVDWYDHHEPGEPPVHPRLTLRIHQAAGACTATIVNQACGGASPVWAAMAAYGDNLPATAEALLRRADFDPALWSWLERAGRLINYNAYAERPGDALFEPGFVAQSMSPFFSAREFSRNGTLLDPLQAQFDADRECFAGLKPAAKGRRARAGSAAPRAYLLPDAPWARRYAATWANERVLARPDEALAMLTPREDGAHVVSIRSPRLEGAPAASDLAGEFPTGGGRRLAGGINALPPEMLDAFLARFLEFYK